MVTICTTYLHNQNYPFPPHSLLLLNVAHNLTHKHYVSEGRLAAFFRQEAPNLSNPLYPATPCHAVPQLHKTAVHKLLITELVREM